MSFFFYDYCIINFHVLFFSYDYAIINFDTLFFCYDLLLSQKCPYVMLNKISESESESKLSFSLNLNYYFGKNCRTTAF